MAGHGKITYPNPNGIDDDTLGDQLKTALKKHLTHKVHLLYVENLGVREIYLIDNHYNDIIEIIVQYRTVSLQLMNEKTVDFDAEAVKEIYKVVKDLFHIWFT